MTRNGETISEHNLGTDLSCEDEEDETYCKEKDSIKN